MYYNWEKETNTEELKIICNLIKNGELVIFPTETVYGIGANAFDELAVGKIFFAKGKSLESPFIVNLADKRKIEEIAQNITEVEQKLIDNFMPGPFTIILEKKEIVPNIVTAGLNTVAVRIPDNIIARGIIQFSGVPIVVSSANVSGGLCSTSLSDVRKELEGKVSALIDGGNTLIGLESTIVKVIDEVPVILRPGKVTAKEIEDVIGKVKLDISLQKNNNSKYRLIYCPNELDQIFYLKKYIKEFENDVVVIGFEEHEEKLYLPQGRFINVGKKDDLDMVAKNIFSAIRKASMMDSEIILVEGTKKDGIGSAIMYHLMNICEYNYIECS